MERYEITGFQQLARNTHSSALPVDYHADSRVHFDELNRYLAEHPSKDRLNPRPTARQKLTRLTIRQFYELSTDTYDEVIRRQKSSDVPFLPAREEFHLKRNQARQKLATLPISRLNDLSSDVHFELARRYPEFQEDLDHSSENFPEAQALDQTFVPVPTHDKKSEEDAAQLLHAGVLASKDSYKSLLEAKGTEAQKILNSFQNLLDSPHVVDDKVRGSILTALLRLSASSGLYPEQLRIRNIKKEPSPMTAGQFGEIWKGDYRSRPVCLKIFKLYQRSDIDHLLKCCSREAIVWSQFTHPNLLPFHGIYHLDDPHGRVGLVSPWMGNGNLLEYLKAHPGSQRLPLVHDILAGLQYLHRHQVVHGDLKGVNVLITADGSACLADFGLSSVINADVLRWTSYVTITKIGGTVRWMAPEIIEAAEDGFSHPTFASDIYSLASVMFEAFTGQVPYYEFPREITVLSKVALGVKPSRPTHEVAPELTDLIWETMINCWSETPGNRPTVDQVISDLSAQSIHASWARPEQVEL